MPVSVNADSLMIGHHISLSAYCNAASASGAFTTKRSQPAN